jgi:thymidylate synthase (FAD)
LHFLRLRMDSHAQWEIQEYARAILNLIEPLVPLTITAWNELKEEA